MEPNERNRLTCESPIDALLDSALKQYGSAEPRPGLENRVLANLRDERQRMTTRRWQCWPAVAVVTAICMVAIGMLLAKLGRHEAQAPVARENRSPIEVSGTEPTQRKNVQAKQTIAMRVHGPRARPRHDTEPENAKIDQFPSPEPLSEQEQILARYVAQFPHEADLMARAQTELIQQEMIERQTAASSESPSSEMQNQ